MSQLLPGSSRTDSLLSVIIQDRRIRILTESKLPIHCHLHEDGEGRIRGPDTIFPYILVHGLRRLESNTTIGVFPDEVTVPDRALAQPMRGGSTVALGVGRTRQSTQDDPDDLVVVWPQPKHTRIDPSGGLYIGSSIVVARRTVGPTAKTVDGRSCVSAHDVLMKSMVGVLRADMPAS